MLTEYALRPALIFAQQLSDEDPDLAEVDLDDEEKDEDEDEDMDDDGSLDEVEK